MRIISLGAGVQSSALLLMALDGNFGDIPDAAIFADTQDEPKRVYVWLDELSRIVAPFPIYRVTAGRLSDDVLAGGSGWIPSFAEGPDGNTAMLKRQCSRHFKIEPIRRKIRELVGPKGTAESWIGISLDEADRMGVTGLQWLTNRYPLIEQGLRWADCDKWLRAHGQIVRESACRYCPLKSEKDWAIQKNEEPEEFELSCQFDEAFRGCRPGFEGSQYLSKRLKPLRLIEFLGEKQFELDGFSNECSGVCGV